MSEPDTSDELQTRIEEAQAAGDIAKANLLYQRQIGNADPYGLEAVPDLAVSDADAVDDIAGQTRAGDLVVATNAEDETVTVSGGMDFAANPEHVAHALACMDCWGEDEVAPLKAKWGSDMGANLGYFQAFALAHPDVHELLVASGFGDHPAIVEAGAILGRAYVTKAGDVGRVTTRKAGVQAVEHMASANIQARIDDLQGAIERAQSQHDSTKANRLFAEQQALYRRLPGGSDPAIGEGGVTA